MASVSLDESDESGTPAPVKKSKRLSSTPQVGVQTFSFWRSFQVIRGHQMVKHWIRCCYCISWVPSFRLICIKPQLKKFSFWRSFQVIRGHQKVKHWIRCCFCIPWVPSFHLICTKPQFKHFDFGGHFRSLEVIRRLNIGFVAATVFLGFLAIY